MEKQDMKGDMKKDRRIQIALVRQSVADFKSFFAQVVRGPEGEKLQILSNKALETLDKMIVPGLSKEEDALLKKEFKKTSLEIRECALTDDLDIDFGFEDESGEFGLGGDWWKQS